MKFTDTYTPKENNNSLLIVDGLNLSFRYKHANNLTFSTQFVTTVASFARSYQAKDVVVLGDGGSVYRKNIFPNYKANREDLRKQQTKEEAETYKAFIEEFDKALFLCGKEFKTFKFKGVEADDIAAYLATKLYKKYDHIWLISSDKDWDLLVNDNVSRFSYRTRKEITKDNWNEHYIYDLDQHISIKVLTGDSGDNIPGVEGIGVKRAYNILRTYGPTAYDTYMSIPINSTYKHIQKLNTFKEQILLNYKLMDLETYAEEAIGSDVTILNEFIKEKL